MPPEENPDYLHEQLITYIGNKRALLPFIGEGVQYVMERIGRRQLDCFDVFSGSGIVSRYLKQYARTLTANDMELYSEIINRCYLSNKSEINVDALHEKYTALTAAVAQELDHAGRRGFISGYYAPDDENNVQKGERCFYTPHNARYIDTVRQLITELIQPCLQPYFIAPLLAEVSVHANTGGVFKGFYKDSKTGRGKFGGNGANALSRIRGTIVLPFPVFSSFSRPFRIFRSDANELACDDRLYAGLPGGMFDLAYIDPPYNQHPYGSNYFMLNLIASYKQPAAAEMSRVSGIPCGWNRSQYNRKKHAAETFSALIHSLRARYLLVSFNSEGFITRDEMVDILSSLGSVKVFESPYNAFRASRNLRKRAVHVSEYLYVVEKKVST
ncbi:MAG: DNA adenine methylase [Treponema sp.]|nr:DNA adenine methylase [Treponema sp.]